METFFTAAVIWIILGFIFFILEFIIPGLILFFFAVGAWIVAILCLFLDISLNMQLIIFLVSSIISVLLLRKWFSTILWKRKHPSDLLEDEFFGKIAVAETDILPGIAGKVEFKGTSWSAASDDTIQKGENVIITGNESILLIVKSTKTI